MARVRFRPPSVEQTPELDWLLRAAFADEFPEAPAGDRDNALSALARRLVLAPVIGARLGQAKETITLSKPLADDFRQAHVQSAIRTALHERTALRIAEIAEQRSIPLVFLKGFALYLAKRDRSGGRLIGDLDVLAPEYVAASLHADLVRSGYTTESEHGNEHHLPTLFGPEGGKIDLHFCIRGLVLNGVKWATWEDLRQRGALRPTGAPPSAYPGDCAVPDTRTQCAHLLVHGLAHHVWRPHRYPLLQLVGDLRELLPDDDAWRDFLSEYRPVLAGSVHEPELDATRRLTVELAAGHVPDLTARPLSDSALVLSHILAGYLDPVYCRGLRFRDSLGRFRDAMRQGQLSRYWARKTRRRR